jgi:hypothetical protein
VSRVLLVKLKVELEGADDTINSTCELPHHGPQLVSVEAIFQEHTEKPIITYVAGNVTYLP